MILKGLDEDWSKVDPTQAAADGFGFAFGYVSQDTTGKNLTADDVARIHAAGMAVALVYEFNPQSALGGYNAGTRDAAIAIAHAQSLAAPADIALYAAVDWNVTDAQKATVLAYANGFADACRAAGFRSGIYAGYWVCLYLLQHNYPGFLWQTYAWSGGLWLTEAVVRQTLNGIHEAGATVDLDESEVIDFGQWEAEMSTGAEAEDMVRLLVQMPDGSVREGVADGVGGWHWITEEDALKKFDSDNPTVAAARKTVTADMALRAYGIVLDPPPSVDTGVFPRYSGTLTLDPAA